MSGAPSSPAVDAPAAPRTAGGLVFRVALVLAGLALGAIAGFVIALATRWVPLLC